MQLIERQRRTAALVHVSRALQRRLVRFGHGRRATGLAREQHALLAVAGVFGDAVPRLPQRPHRAAAHEDGGARHPLPHRLSLHVCIMRKYIAHSSGFCAVSFLLW